MLVPSFGTLQVSDALVNMLENQTTNILDYGADLAYDQIAEDAAAWNRVVKDELATFTQPTDDAERLYGGVNQMVSQYGDEVSIPFAQKVTEGTLIGFGIYREELNIQWTYDWMASHTISQLMAQWTSAKEADLRWTQGEIQAALYRPTNRPVRLSDGTVNPNAYRDRLINNVPRPIFGLLNADGYPVPIGPNGEQFDPNTHTHYMASAWSGKTNVQQASDALALVRNVTEHGIVGKSIIQINSSDEMAWRNLPGFIQLYEPGTIVANNITYAGGAELDIYNPNNRLIGRFQGFDVWVKPYAFVGYAVAIDYGNLGDGTPEDPGSRPLVWRSRKNGLWSDFTISFTNPQFKLQANMMKRDGGASVWNRHKAAILYTGGSTYQVPSGLAR